jgi:hypothetical protein
MAGDSETKRSLSWLALVGVKRDNAHNPIGGTRRAVSVVHLLNTSPTEDSFSASAANPMWAVESVREGPRGLPIFTITFWVRARLHEGDRRFCAKVWLCAGESARREFRGRFPRRSNRAQGLKPRIISNRYAVIHHGTHSSNQPYTVLDVIGTVITARLRAELGEFGFDDF